MEYVDCKNVDFRLLYKKLTPDNLKQYMFESLKVIQVQVLGIELCSFKRNNAQRHKATQFAL